MSIRRLSYFAIAVCMFGAVAVSSPGSVSEAAAPAKAYFAGGCFWCMEEAFEKVEGVVSVVSGYMGGSVSDPTYEQVSAGRTGHAEAVEISYDPSKISYQKLL
ncbi:MAG: peptide-methionine (S)-S-oxide reductase, partial [Nitrospira sp.]|nr:peptide-methionine (S)-S-oxide reductase [Nitrospira sp.]